MDKNEKYYSLRNEIKDGDIILLKGSRLMSHLVSFFDDAYWTHAGVAFWSNERLMIIDSNAKGVEPDFMSDRIRTYIDFRVLRVKNQEYVKSSLVYVFAKAEAGIKYDFMTLVRIAAKRKMGLDLKNLGSTSRDVCSEFVRRFTNICGVKCYSDNREEIRHFISPQDFVRYFDKQEIAEIEP